MAARKKSSGEIVPEKITKPIQLLATWFLSLVLIDAGFFAAARVLQALPWIAWFLVVAAIVNVYVFVYCIFKLQTKYRVQIQEDSYYSKFLGKMEIVSPEMEQIKAVLSETQRLSLQREGDLQKQISELSRIASILNRDMTREKQPVVEELQREVANTQHLLDFSKRWAPYQISVNDLLPNYSEIVDFFESRGVRITDTFGSTSKPSHPPVPFTLSYGAGVDVSSLQELLRFLLERGLKAINVVDTDDPTLQDLSERRFYIGSYAYKEFPVAFTTAELVRELLKENISLFDFTNLVRRNSRKISAPAP